MSPPGPDSLRTERVLLRAWREADRVPFAALNADPDVMEHFPSTLSRVGSDLFMDRIVSAFASGAPRLWAVEVPGVADFIGYVGLAVPGFEAHFTPCVEVGWRLARDAWGHGYATEAARAVLADGFGRLGLDEIVSFTTVANVRSRRVMERLGMSHDPADDFDHPRLAPDYPELRHVLYRLARPSPAPGGGAR